MEKKYSEKSVLIKILIIEDEDSQIELLKQTIEIFNSKDQPNKINADFSKDGDESLVKLIKNDYQAVIIDLKLAGDEHGDNLTGNKLVDIIVGKLRLPIVIRSGTPQKFDSVEIDDTNKFLAKYSKDDRITDIFNQIIDWHNIGLYSSIGTTGYLDRVINEIYWSKISENIDEWKKNGDEKGNHKSFLRYTINVLQSYLEIDEDTNLFEDYHPAEMYIKPPIIKSPYFGDILKDTEGNYYVILTPSCELAQKKSKKILLVRVINFGEVPNFITDKETYLAAMASENPESNSNRKKADNFYRWFRNGHDNSLGYHFLPAYSDFPGGFIDFQKVLSISLSIDGTINEKYIKIATITNQFSKDMSARFTSYYGRQGQPVINTQMIVDSLIKPI